jgi:hypothetical protein
MRASGVKQVIRLILPVVCAAAIAHAQTLDTTAFVVMGEGLAAGMGNYGLSSVLQNQDFAVLVAGKMHTAIEQPLIQPPGIGDVIGYPTQEVQVQKYPQGSVRQTYLPTDPTKDPIATPPLFVTNVSVPALTLNDSVTMRPVAPVVQRGNMKQTVFNMILGFPQLILNNVQQWTQLEYATSLRPTVALVELGYYEALDAAVKGDPSLIPAASDFGSTYSKLLSELRSTQAQVIVMTIPNPIDTAYFNSAAAAAGVVHVSPSDLTGKFGLNSQDYITRNGIEAISAIFLSNGGNELPAGSTLAPSTAAAITNGVNALNTQIVNAAKANGAVVYDLNALLHRVKVSGATAGATTVNGDYLGGFYSLDGVYPGATGHAVIANDLLAFLNQTFHQSFEAVDLAAIAAADPAVQLRHPKASLSSSAARQRMEILRGRRR